MNTVVNHKSKDILQVSWAENTPAVWQGATAQKRRDSQNAIAWGSCPGQAIAARRAAQERRSKQTWPVTPDNTASERRFSRSSDEASNATLKSCLPFSQEWVR
jgi:hypothetical protein